MHNTNFPERIAKLSGFETICGGGRCSQKSSELGVLHSFIPGNENKSSGVRMMVLSLSVGVALVTVTAVGVFVMVVDGVCEKVGTRLEDGDRLSVQLLKTRLKRKRQEMIIRILLLLALLGCLTRVLRSKFV